MLSVNVSLAGGGGGGGDDAVSDCVFCEGVGVGPDEGGGDVMQSVNVSLAWGGGGT